MLYSRLVDYYLRLARQALDNAFGPARGIWMDRLEHEHINLQPVFSWLLEQQDAERGLKLAFLLQELWFEDRYTSEGRELFARLLHLPGASAPTSMRAECLDLAGAFALSQEDYVEARRLKLEGINLCRELGDEAVLGSALIHLGHVELFAGNFAAAHQHYQESLQIFTGLEEPAWIARAMGNLSNTALELGDYAQAGQMANASLKRYSDLGLEWELVGELGIAAGVAARLGQPGRAIRLAAASAAHRQRLGVSLPPAFQERFEKLIEPARKGLDEEQHKVLWEQGCGLSLEAAVEEALSTQPDSPS
jgi:tetratricopeptide (TPR) repeat protein